MEDVLAPDGAILRVSWFRGGVFGICDRCGAEGPMAADIIWEGQARLGLQCDGCVRQSIADWRRGPGAYYG